MPVGFNKTPSSPRKRKYSGVRDKTLVIPAKAEIQCVRDKTLVIPRKQRSSAFVIRLSSSPRRRGSMLTFKTQWIPAFAGMTSGRLRGNDELGAFAGMTNK